MATITKKQMEEYERLRRDRDNGRVLTPDGLRLICAAYANVKHFFTSLGNEFFTSYGKQFFTLYGKDFFTRYGKQFFTLYGKEIFTFS